MREFVNHVHLVGVGGIGMSGIAEVLLDIGFRVSGSDLRSTPITKRLVCAGAEVFCGHDAQHVRNADVVVYSSAVDGDNPEIRSAREHGIPLVSRAEMLGELMRFRKGIAITGTHGKTTTTSLVVAILASAGMDPTFIVGGIINSAASNARLGKGELMVAEADESDVSFLHLQPQMAVVTNIDRDHMSSYGGDFSRLKQAYVDFLHNLPFYGLAVLCFDDPAIREISDRLNRPFVSYGLSDHAEYQAVDIRQHGTQCTFGVIRDARSVGRFSLALPGHHNVQNALAAIAIGYKLELPVEPIRNALGGFEGIGRRFEHFGRVRLASHVIELVDDYAHHPSEIAATLQAARGCWPDRRLCVVFQPHRYSRLQDLFEEFVDVLSGLGNLIVTEVYPAGEHRIAGCDGRALSRAVRKRGGVSRYVERLDDLEDEIDGIVDDDDIVLTLGAGDIGRFSGLLGARAIDHGTAN